MFRPSTGRATSPRAVGVAAPEGVLCNVLLCSALSFARLIRGWGTFCGQIGVSGAKIECYDRARGVRPLPGGGCGCARGVLCSVLLCSALSFARLIRGWGTFCGQIRVSFSFNFHVGGDDVSISSDEIDEEEDEEEEEEEEEEEDEEEADEFDDDDGTDLFSCTRKYIEAAKARALKMSLSSGCYPEFKGIEGPYLRVNPDSTNPSEFLRMLWPDCLCDLLVEETNRYAR